MPPTPPRRTALPPIARPPAPDTRPRALHSRAVAGSPPDGRRPRFRWAATVLAVLALAGCGAPPEVRGAVPTGIPSAPAPPTAIPTPPVSPATGLPVAPTLPAGPTTDAGLVATACRNGPTGQRIIQLLRGRAGVLPDAVRVRVRSGPLCAADWQYTVLDVTGHEELQVVTRGRPGAPELVTAGTDVCTIEVRATAPAGIRALTCDGGTVGVPGA